MNDFINNLKHQAEENPVIALGVTAALITAISKLVDSSVSAKNSKAWDREVARRIIKDTQK
jgi:uncharacterized BrkB/YihY/UPF0761 family membrane protein